MDEKEALVKNWLIKAQHDLLVAKKLSAGQEVPWMWLFIIASKHVRKL